MAPRTRAMTKSQRAGLFNSRGFAALPIELYYQILSYMQGPIIPCHWSPNGLMDGQYRERRHVLRVLCQLSRSLRATLLPLLWERLEACAFKRRLRHSFPSQRLRHCCVRPPRLVPRSPLLAEELIGQLKLINIRKLPYASYVSTVRTVNVAIEAGREDETLRGLARSLTLMPNLHTIQIICERGDSTPTVEGDKFDRAFAGRCYPSVRRAVLPIQATDIFHCFPEVREVYLNQPWTFRVPGYVESLSRHCPKVESFGWTDNYASLTVNAIVQYIPNIRRLTFDLALTTCKPDEIIQLSKLKSLEKITVKLKRGTDLDNGGQAKKAIEAVFSPPRRRLDLVFLGEDQAGIFAN